MELSRGTQNPTGSPISVLTHCGEKGTFTTEKSTVYSRELSGPNSDVGSLALQEGPKSPLASSTPKLTSGSIRERILALQMAAQMPELDVTPVRESANKGRSHLKVTTSAPSQKTFKIDFFRESCGKTESEDNFETLKKTEGDLPEVQHLEDNLSVIEQQKTTGIAFEVDFGGRTKKGSPPCIPARFKTKSPTKKEKRFDFESKAKEQDLSLKSPTKRKGEDNVTLPSSPKTKEIRHESMNSEHKSAPVLNPISVEVKEEASKLESQQLRPGSKSKGVAFEVDFSDKTSPPHCISKLKYTPFRLKRTGKGALPGQSSRLQTSSRRCDEDSIQKIVSERSKINTQFKTALDGSRDTSSAQGRAVSPTLDPLQSTLNKQVFYKPKGDIDVEDTDKEMSAFEELKSKPSLVRRGTYNLLDSVTEQRGQACNALDGKMATIGNVPDLSDKPLAQHGVYNSEKVASALESTAEQSHRVCGAPDVEMSTVALPDLKRKPLIRRGTYSSERVTSVLETAVDDAGSILVEKSAGVIPDVSQCTPPEEVLPEVKRVSGSDQNECHLDLASQGQTSSSDDLSESLQKLVNEEGSVATVLEELANCIELACEDSQALNTPRNRGTYDLDNFSQALQQPHITPNETSTTVPQQLGGTTEPQCLLTPSNRGTYTLDEVAHALEKASAEGGNMLKALEQLSTEQSVEFNNTEEQSLTVPCDEVTQALHWVNAGGDSLVLDEFACSAEVAVSDKPEQSVGSPGKRGTYSLDEVAQTLQLANAQGDSLTEVLDELACSTEHSEQQEQSLSAPGKQVTSSLDEVTQQTSSLKRRTLGEASENIASCNTSELLSDFDTSEQGLTGPGQRGTYTLDEVSLALEKASSEGGTVVEALEQLAGDYQSPTEKGRSCPVGDVPRMGSPTGSSAVNICGEPTHASGLGNKINDDSAKAEPSQKRGTYTLDEVSVALQAASKEGVPLVETLENLARTQEGGSKDSVQPKGTSNEVRDKTSRKSLGESSYGLGQQTLVGPEVSSSAGDRATYTLEGVSHSLEAAQSRGVPLIDALANLADKTEAGETPTSTPGNRGTYTLEEVSLSLEAAREKGLPVVELLEQLASSAGGVAKRTPEAVYRRQQKLVNRKTYALARPLETIGETANVKLFDGSNRRMLSATAVKKLEETSKKASGTSQAEQAKGLVKTLDFLTSACEVLMETTAKTAALDLQRQEMCSDILANSTETAVENSGKVVHKTYSLEDVALTIDEAKAAGLPVVKALNSLSSTRSEPVPKDAPFTNLTRLCSKSDSALTVVKDSENTDRHTHSMEDMSQALEKARTSGLPVIQALDELTKELARFKVADIKVKSEEKQAFYQSQSSNSTPELRGRMTERNTHALVFGTASDTQENSYLPSFRKAASLDSVAAAPESVAPDVPEITSNKSDTQTTVCSSCMGDFRFSEPSTHHQCSSSDSDLSQGNAKRGTYTLDNVSTCLETAKKDGLPIVDALQRISTESERKYDHSIVIPTEAERDGFQEASGENRRTLTLDHEEQSVDSAIRRGLPIVDALADLAERSETKQESQNSLVPEMKASSTVGPLAAVKLNGSVSSKPWKSHKADKTHPLKPGRKALKKVGVEASVDPFFVEIFSDTPSSPSVVCGNDKVSQLSSLHSLNQSGLTEERKKEGDCVVGGSGNNSQASVTSKIECKESVINPASSKQSSKALTSISSDIESAGGISQAFQASQTDSEQSKANLIHETSQEISEDSLSTVGQSCATNTTPPTARAMWRPSGSVLDKISNLLDSAEGSGLSVADTLEQAAIFCADQGW